MSSEERTKLIATDMQHFMLHDISYIGIHPKRDFDPRFYEWKDSVKALKQILVNMSRKNVNERRANDSRKDPAR